MQIRPEIMATAGSMEELKRVIRAGADAVNIGEQKFGMRLAGEFKLEQIADAVQLAHQHQAKIIVSVNNIMNNCILDEIPEYLAQLQRINVDAIIFGDPAVLISAKQFAPGLALHWSAEMTSTNYATANYWASKGASRVILARELNMEQVLEIKQQVSMEVQVQVHGVTNIYHSKRNLVHNYRQHQGKGTEEPVYDKDRGLFLVEEERPDETYPIYEDGNGTHIMSADDICMIENLPELLEGGINSLKIEGLMKSMEYNETVVRVYRQAVDAYMKEPAGYRFNPAWLEQIEQIQDPKRELSYGFFYKEQVY